MINNRVIAFLLVFVLVSVQSVLAQNIDSVYQSYLGQSVESFMNDQNFDDYVDFNWGGNPLQYLNLVLIRYGEKSISLIIDEVEFVEKRSTEGWDWNLVKKEKIAGIIVRDPYYNVLKEFHVPDE